MQVFKGIVLLAGLLFCVAAQAELINFQEAIEASEISISAWSSGKGRLKARSCSSCEPVKLEITPDTIILVDGERVTGRTGINRHWPGGIVIYDVETRQVVKLEL